MHEAVCTNPSCPLQSTLPLHSVLLSACTSADAKQFSLWTSVSGMSSVGEWYHFPSSTTLGRSVSLPPTTDGPLVDLLRLHRYASLSISYNP